MNQCDNSETFSLAWNSPIMSATVNPRPRILVFDSGLGGLSIVQELAHASLDVDIYYVADTAYFPYGEKGDAILIERVPWVIYKAVEACDPSLVIIACNTASTLALEAVRGAINIPVIGVVPAIKPAATLTKTGTIGLLATPNTVSRPYTDQLIKDFAGSAAVVRHGAIGLAATVESKLSGGAVDTSVIKASIDGLFSRVDGDNIDVVVLACTHYPHVRAELAAFAPRVVTWVDSGAAIARRARVVLDLLDGVSALRSAYTTGGRDSATASGLLAWGFAASSRLA
jgi:glutamate racemase